jgi:hypothetical protein
LAIVAAASDAGVHALAACRTVDVGRIPGDENARDPQSRHDGC